MKTWIIERTNHIGHIEINADFITTDNACLILCNKANAPEDRGIVLAVFASHTWSSIKLKEENIPTNA